MRKFGAIIGGIAIALGAFALLLWKRFAEGRAVGKVEGRAEAKLGHLEDASDDELHDDLTEFE